MQTLASLWVTTTTTVLRPFFRDYLGEPVPEDNFWTLWCKGRLTEADTLTIWLGATASRLTIAHLHHPPYFYRPDALPVAQPTVLKHWRQLAHSDYGEDVRVLINGVTCTVSVSPSFTAPNSKTNSGSKTNSNVFFTLYFTKLTLSAAMFSLCCLYIMILKFFKDFANLCFMNINDCRLSSFCVY